ncbi:hypothetical protein GCM10029976_090320 [Kribbella albertanoniae]
MTSDLSEFADWLDGEAIRLRDNRWKMHGGTRHRYDLDHWADALRWAARKARQRADTPGAPTDFPVGTPREHGGVPQVPK